MDIGLLDFLIKKRKMMKERPILLLIQYNFSYVFLFFPFFFQFHLRLNMNPCKGTAFNLTLFVNITKKQQL